VSCFCTEIQLSRKFPENIAKLLFYQKTHEARRRDGDEPRGAHTTWPCGPGQAAPGGGMAASATASSPHFAYIKSLTLKTEGGSTFFQIEFRYAATTGNLNLEPETLFWHPVRTGNWRRSSPSSSPTPIHQPSMIPPSMCE
jgi:hypothetical protein